jgi:hypothetical protein
MHEQAFGRTEKKPRQTSHPHFLPCLFYTLAYLSSNIMTLSFFLLLLIKQCLVGFIAFYQRSLFILYEGRMSNMPS